MDTGLEVISKIKSLKSESEGSVFKRNQGVMTGALIGAAGGVLFGLAKSYSLIGSGMTGALLGALTAFLILPKPETEEA